jgi:uncharacterized metal-binding protein YceD (DUF177 family)
MNEKFTIPLNGLATGKNEFFVHVGKEFFSSFENEEILDADLQVRILVEKSGRYVGVDCDIEGDVTVECDRCLEPLEMPIDAQVRLSVKFGEEEVSEIGSENEREVIFVMEDDTELDMAQIIYDYSCLALPMQRMHDPEDCNPDAMRYFEAEEDDGFSGDSEGVNPFAALKDMFK